MVVINTQKKRRTMIKKTGNIVGTPLTQKDENKQDLCWLEVFPKTPKEIAFYGTINKRYTSAGDLFPWPTQSPLLVELSEARRLGLA